MLLVVDNSPSMAGEADHLGAQLDDLVQALNDLGYGFPDARIGVISSDLGTGSVSVPGCSASGDAGVLLSQPLGDCEGPKGPYIDVSYWDGVLRANVTSADADGAVAVSDIQAALRCIAALGSKGCGYEQPLEAAKRALTCTEDECRNPGFRRPGAMLAVIFITDEDDCSARDDSAFDPDVQTEGGCRCFDLGVDCTDDGCEPNEEDGPLFTVQHYSDFFGRLAPHNRFVMGAVTGPFEPGNQVEKTTDSQGDCVLQPACDRATDTAFPAVRIGDLVRRFGDNGTMLSDHDGVGICGDGLGTVLRRLGEFGFDRHPACISEPLLDSRTGNRLKDPADAACVVTEVNADERVDLPRCDFEGSPPFACPDHGESPGPVNNAPCWLICESPWCKFQWSYVSCRDAGCSPWVLPRPATDDLLLCLTCDPLAPGCLCGNGVCDADAGEDRDSCSADCLD